MLLRKAAKGVIRVGYSTYRIGFDDGDETEFSACNLKELEALYRSFCKESGLKQNTVDYVESV